MKDKTINQQTGHDMNDMARLRWRCRRGMRELDKAMLGYLNTHYQQASEQEQQDFERLLDWQEPELYRLVCGKDKDDRYQYIIDKIAAVLADSNTAV